jgi:hypothetical protein
MLLCLGTFVPAYFPFVESGTGRVPSVEILHLLERFVPIDLLPTAFDFAALGLEGSHGPDRLPRLPTSQLVTSPTSTGDYAYLSLLTADEELYSQGSGYSKRNHTDDLQRHV